MRFLKDKIFYTEEIICDSSNIFEFLSQVSYGSDIYQISTEQYDKLKHLEGLELVKAITTDEKNSIFNAKKIGLFNKNLIGSPLVLFDKQNKLKTRSFSFLFRNKEAEIDKNECEIIDDYPDIFNTRDIIKYHTDRALYTDTPLKEIIKNLINNSENFYHVTQYGFLMKTTPKEYQEQEKVNRIISKGKIPARRIEISQRDSIQMLDEMCGNTAPTK